MLSFKEFLSESFNDKHIYKAIFIVGLPAAGKSTISKKLACKTIDIDDYYEFVSWKEGRNIDDIASKIGDVKDSLSMEDAAKLQKELRRKSRDMLEVNVKNAINGVLPITIGLVGTKARDKLIVMKEELEKVGYDTFCIYINQSAELSYEGNKKRYLGNIEKPRKGKAAREVSYQYIKKTDEELHKQIEILQDEFGENFAQIDKISNDKDMFDPTTMNASIKKCNAFLNSPVKNHVGKELIKAFRTDPRDKKYLKSFSPDLSDYIDSIAKNIRIAQGA
jgi:dephospho-CoA kinase